MKRVLMIIIFYLLIFLPSGEGKEKDEPLILEQADKLEYLKVKAEDKETISIGGSIKLKYRNMQLKADKIEINLKTKDLIAQGNIIYIKGEEKIFGEKMSYNLETEKGVVQEAIAILKPIFCKGKTIEKVSEKEIKVEKGTLTTCDLEKPHYHFRARRILIYLKDKLVAKHVFFYVGRIPLFYMPVYIVSLKEGVVSRFAPQIGYTEEEGWFVKSVYGYFFHNSFYGDLYLDWIEKKGWGKGFDTRYKLGEKGEGMLYLYYIDEKEVVYDVEKGEYYNPPDATLTKRWKARLKHRHLISKDTTALLHLYFLSDEKFPQDYSEDMRDRLRKELKSYLSITKTKPAYNLRLLVSKKEDLVEEEAVKLERVPELSYRLNPCRIGSSPLFYKINTSLVNFHEPREDIYVIRGDTSLSLINNAIRLNKGTNLNTEIGCRGTWYNKGKDSKEEIFRSAYNTKLRIDTRITKHIKNELSYKLSRQIEEDLTVPFSFDGVDISPKYNKIEENLRLRMKGVNLRIRSGYDFDKGEEEIEKNFKNISTYLTIFPTKPVKFYMDTNYDIYEEEFKRISADLEIKREEERLINRLKVGTKYYNSGDTVFDLTSEVGLKLGKKWKLNFFSRYDVNEREFKNRDYLLYRDLHCWEARFIYREFQGEFFLSLNIKAFPQTIMKFYHNFFESRWSFMEDF